MATWPLTLYVFDISYFSGKMEAYLRYKEIPHERVEISWIELARDVYPETGLMKVPLVRLPDGRWLQDTTPMIDRFEAQHPEGRVIPTDPYQAFLSRLVEDYADEWMWRPALHYRWSYARDARLLSGVFCDTFLRTMPGPRAMKRLQVRQRQEKVYVRGDGVTDETRAHVEGVYLRTLDRLEKILETRPFLLGERPSLADFGFFASMFRHFSLDPTPSKIMRARAPGVYAWVVRLWAARRSAIEVPEAKAWPAAGTVPEEWGPILTDIGEAYLPSLHANALAWRDGRKRHDLTVQGVTYRALPTVQYRVWCRERLQEHFDALPEDAKTAVEETLRTHGCWEPLQADGRIASHLHDGVEPPFCRKPEGVGKGPLALLARLYTGTDWNRPDLVRKESA